MGACAAFLCGLARSRKEMGAVPALFWAWAWAPATGTLATASARPRAEGDAPLGQEDCPFRPRCGVAEIAHAHDGKGTTTTGSEDMHPTHLPRVATARRCSSYVRLKMWVPLPSARAT